MDKPMFLKLHEDDLEDIVFQTNTAGVTFAKNADKILEFLRDKVSPDDIFVRLVREPENEYDSNAVRVEVSVRGAKNYHKVGYIPKDKNSTVSYALLNQALYSVITFQPVVVGGMEGKENLGLYFKYRIQRV